MTAGRTPRVSPDQGRMWRKHVWHTESLTHRWATCSNHACTSAQSLTYRDNTPRKSGCRHLALCQPSRKLAAIKPLERLAQQWCLQHSRHAGRTGCLVVLVATHAGSAGTPHPLPASAPPQLQEHHAAHCRSSMKLTVSLQAWGLDDCRVAYVACTTELQGLTTHHEHSRAPLQTMACLYQVPHGHVL